MAPRAGPEKTGARAAVGHDAAHGPDRTAPEGVTWPRWHPPALDIWLTGEQVVTARQIA